MYDAILLVSFGGPERREDVLPFLENVTRGRNVPGERLLKVAEHYYHFGGVSPINDQCRELMAALRKELTSTVSGFLFTGAIATGARSLMARCAKCEATV
jgi:ferrochelatase